jgi:hypothetical protein
VPPEKEADAIPFLIRRWKRGRKEGKERGEVMWKSTSSAGGIGSGPRKTAGMPWNRKERFTVNHEDTVRNSKTNIHHILICLYV